MDGTLTDSGEGICNSVRYALRELGRPVPGQKVLERFVGPPLDKEFRAVCGLNDEETERAVRAFRVYYNETGIRQNRLYPGIEGLLTALLQAGRTLHVATTKPLILAGKVLDMFGIARYFTLVCGSGSGHAGRAKKDVIAEVLEKGGIDAARALMVGDRRHDVEGATAHGIPCVGVLYGYGGREELEKAGAAALAQNAAELEKLVLGY